MNTTELIAVLRNGAAHPDTYLKQQMGASAVLMQTAHLTEAADMLETLNNQARKFNDTLRKASTPAGCLVGDDLTVKLVPAIETLVVDKTTALKALRATQAACAVDQCPWCGVWGVKYSESERPADYCHHEYQVTPWQALWPQLQRTGKDPLFAPCCANEQRTLAGGCKNCGDPCL